MRYINYLTPFVVLLLLTSCFRTSAPIPDLEPGATDGTLQFAIIGDYGTDTQSEADVAALVDSWNVDFVATVGDNNYNSGAASTIDRNIGKYYQKYIKPYTGSYGSGSADINRFWPALGNHDWDSISCSSSNCSGPYMDYFELPNNERYYDVQIDSVHLFILDSDSKEPDGISRTSAQANWLRDKLAASSAPHKLVLLHHAPYSSSSNHGSNTTLQWPFEAWGATAVFSGHDHHYERLTVGTIPYFVNGSGGRPLYPLGNPLPETQVAYDDDFGAMLMQVENTQIRYQFFNRRGTLIDSYLQDNSVSSNTVSRQVATGNDDAEERDSGAVYLSSTDLELVSDTGLGYIEQTVGMRFNDIGVPRGATILEAYLEFTVDEVSTDPTNLQFVGEAADNANVYSSGAFNISSRPTTAAQVAWDAVPQWPSVGAKHRSPNLALIVQEIIDRSGWQSGNALALMVTGTGRRTAESQNGSVSNAPKLVIRYDASTHPPPTNTSPTISSPGSQQNTEGDPVSLQVQASDADGDTLSYSATGLPSGLSISSTGGLISGTLSSGSAGSYTVNVSVSDSQASASASFNWNVQARNTGSEVTLERRISVGNDDVEENGEGRVYLGSSDLELVTDTGLGYSSQIIGLRFVDITIPAGATIEQAYLEFMTDEVSTSPTSLNLQAEASDNAPAFTFSQNNVSSRTRTSEAVTWSDIAPWNQIDQIHQSADISPVVQAIVDRSGWQSGNALALIITGSGTRTARSYNGSPTKAPKLVVRYRSGSNPPPPPPTNNPPNLNAPGNQTHTEGQAINLQLSASDPDGDSLTYSATGLPSGLSLNSSTGLISGNLASGSVGNYSVNISVIDGRGGSDSESFSWSVTRTPQTRTVRFTFESGDEGFTLNPNGSDSASTGRWQRANPEPSSYNSYVMQLGNAAEGQYALVTDGRAGTSVGSYDVDNGVTSIRSPDIDLSNARSASVSLSYYLAHLNNSSSEDFLSIKVVGNTTTTLLDERGAANYDNATWQTGNYDLNQYAGEQIYLLIETADASGASLVEAAIDNIVITFQE